MEFDAPPGHPDLAPEEKGGALAWSHIGTVEIRSGFWAEKRAGAVQVVFLAKEFKRGPMAMTIPRHWPWGIVVPYIRKETAEKIVALSRPFIQAPGESSPPRVGLPP